jgi:hypothetical protein
MYRARSILTSFLGWIRVRPVTDKRGHRTGRTSLREMLAGFDGKWVAISHGQVVAASDSPYSLVAELRSRRIDDASIIRAPGSDEPEMVAFG